MLRLHRLNIENFKRVEAVGLVFHEQSGAFEIAGRNGQGKSSTIDAIWAALGGAKALPDEPIRQGSRQATLLLDLGELQVKREFDSRGTRLIVTSADGSRLSSPQAVLDSLIDRLAFDPLDFTRQAPSRQAETLRRVAGLDFTDIERKRADLYTERTQVNKAVKVQEARLFEMPEIEPAEPVSVTELTEQLTAANDCNQAIDSATRELNRQETLIQRIETDQERTLDELFKVQARLNKLASDLADAKLKRNQMASEIGGRLDTSLILAQLKDAERINCQVRAYQERQAAVDAIRANRGHSEDLTIEIERLDREKTRHIEDAPMPIRGLGLEGDTVTFEGVPFSQISSAQQIRVSLAMAAALNPKLRLIVIREGSLLDMESLAEVARWANEQDYQVLIERVADSTIGTGVVIEQGRVKASAPASEPESETSLF